MNYKQKILQFLNETTEPVDVEKIRVACDIGNWATALNHCLELLIQGKIMGQKTSKSWVFSTHQETQLESWQEAVGTYEDLQITEEKITLTISTHRNITLTFPSDTPEAETLTQALTDTPKGTKIALLKTDNPQKPIIIRTLKEARVANNECLAFLWLRKTVLWVAFKQFSVCCVEVFVYAV
jgi:hypothetical protein